MPLTLPQDVWGRVKTCLRHNLALFSVYLSKNEGYMESWLAVRLIRVRYNLSQAEMAEQIGVNVKAMTDIESGRTALTLTHIAAYAKFLGISRAALVDFIDQLADPKCIFPALHGAKPPKVSQTSVLKIKSIKPKAPSKRRAS
jgi:transcriptional regulator with XRE-family HTH domain